MDSVCKNPNYTVLDKFLWNFYIVDRNRTTFQYIHEVPNLYEQMVPMFIALIVLEAIGLKISGKPLIRINDGITSVALGMLMDTLKLFVKGIEIFAYSWIYQYRQFEFDWDSAWTWYAAFLGVDFMYYWFHRMTHEIHLFWSLGHQVHHSSEEYNLTTALRQSAFQRFIGIGFYMPLAFIGIPVPAILTHLQFSLLNQFWIHTEFASSLGPIGWIFNTPSYHRVHHGSNKWCLDKNYGAFLIIWDRLFGTFQEERHDEKIVYGLVSQPQTFNPFYLQTFYLRYAIQKAKKQKTWTKFIKSLFYGPGWRPGSARLGNPSDLADRTPLRKKYNPELSAAMNIYLLFHFLVLILVYQELVRSYNILSWLSTIMFLCLMFSGLYIIGSFLDGNKLMAHIEALRCAVSAFLVYQIFPTDSRVVLNILTVYFSFSTILWICQPFLWNLQYKSKHS